MISATRSPGARLNVFESAGESRDSSKQRAVVRKDAISSHRDRRAVGMGRPARDRRLPTFTLGTPSCPAPLRKIRMIRRRARDASIKRPAKAAPQLNPCWKSAPRFLYAPKSPSRKLSRTSSAPHGSDFADRDTMMSIASGGDVWGWSNVGRERT